MMRAIVCVIPGCLLAQPALVDSLTGSWINENRDSPAITQVVVRREGGRMVVHAWGSCRPVDCDHGEVDAELWNGIPIAIWKKGWSTSRMQLIPQPDGRLLIGYRTEYHDGSGRNDAGRAEFFAREAARPVGDAEAQAAIHEVAETYRNISSALIAFDETTNRIAGKSEVRTVRHVTVFYVAPGLSREESSGSGEKTVRITDGQSEWLTYPATNEYRVTPQGKNAMPEPLRSYSLLDKSRAVPRLIGREQFRRADCTVVELAMERGVIERLWIENATHLVRKEVFEEPPARKSETVFTLVHLGEMIPAPTFAYDPVSARAKNRTQLAREAPETLIGRPAPEFGLRDFNGGEVRLSELRGKVVLLDFWGTWCGPCREALPMIELLHRGLKDKGLAVFGIDSEPPEIAREYLRKYNYTLPSLVDTDDEAAGRYHVQGWPTTVIIDRDGKVTYYALGHEPEKLRDAIRALGLW